MCLRFWVGRDMCTCLHSRGRYNTVARRRSKVKVGSTQRHDSKSALARRAPAREVMRTLQCRGTPRIEAR
eukprot:797422-Alexandrium_andersonii.AAC.1